MNENKKRVVVAMSGGVDSSVAAVLLKKQGFDAIGIFMKFWVPKGNTKNNTNKNTDLHKYENRCCSSEAEKRARAVAAKLEIPFYVLNFEKEFKKKVVDYFIKEYKAGKTPNPCVVCNKEIKFGLLLEKALKLDADFVATGHYVRIHPIKYRKAVISASPKLFDRVKLLKGKDKNKDQSYFLWKLSQKQLSRILFPVGNYTKEEVRALARKFKLPTAEAPESQEACFVSKNTQDFLKKYINPKQGKIIDETGRIIGSHAGSIFYTIGQRKGIKLSGGPYYVLNKDTKKNVLIVAKKEQDLYKKELVAKNINWISGKEPKTPLKADVKIRYRHNFAPALIKKQRNGGIKIVFSKPQKAITSGQSAVFYLGEELLGGGVIA